MPMACRSMYVWVALTAGTLGGCHSTSAKDVIDKDSTFAERNASTTLHWNVAASGKTLLVIADEAGNALKKDVTGQLTFKPESGGEPKTVPLALDAKSGIASADGPALNGELTEVRYALVAADKPLTGSLYVPKQGTAGLVESAKSAAPAATEPGAHGGTIQVIDGKKYEVVADSESGEVRVYLIDADAKHPKKLELGLESDDPRVVQLKWNDEGYYVAEVGAEKPPRTTTLVVVDDDDHVHVCVVGFRPGVVLVLDSRPVYWTRRDWGHPGLARGHFKGTIDGPPGQFKERERDDDEKFKGGKGKGKGH